MTRVFMLALVALLTVFLFYLSRFWGFALWSRPGLFGSEALPPQGGLVARWLRGTDVAQFELLIWAVGCFLVLSMLQRLYEWLSGKE
ncbi:MAG: hypothetical protein AAF636_07230 [Pseudomonadota bacterium]